MFRSEQKRMRRQAENWLRLAEKVYHYRHDLLKEKELQELVGASTHLQETLRRKEDASRLRLAVERMEDALRKYGGPYYRKSAWSDNVEVLLVAAILAIGIRTYFVQPFKIPTNSMWPTYNGMTHEVFTEGDQPDGAAALFRKLAFGASRHRVEAPVDGEIQIAVQQASGGRGSLPAELVSTRNWLVFPGRAYRYLFYVGGHPVGVEVPLEFQIESVFHDAFFPEAASLQEGIRAQEQAGNITAGPNGLTLIGTGKHVQQGELALSFDLLTGDQLFVDRMSYHFVRPKVGDGFVFRTGGIPGLARPDGTPEDKYYIKRLVGIGGDELEIEPPVLLRNGEPIGNRPVFEKIQNREGRYTGYVNEGLLSPGRTVTVPEDHFFAMGDNSSNSRDSRSWGFVPAEEVVGRSLLIYYPFTKRWGPAR